MRKMLMLASIALVTALGCDQNDRSMTAERDRTTTPPPATTPGAVPGAVDSGVTTARPATMTDADRALAQRVEETLRQDTAVASAAQNVQVHANNGQVTLMGSVSSQQEKMDLASKAQQVTGVTQVDNKLTVVSASR